MADRAYIADENRDYINTHGNILDFEATQRKEIFFLTMALGMDEPKKLPKLPPYHVRANIKRRWQ